MTVLSAVQSAATQIAIEPVPTQVFASTDREMIEMKALANEVARQVTDEFDWPLLKKIHTLTGDGTEEDFAVPADFDRMVKVAQLWSSRVTTTPLIYVPSVDDWLAMTVQDFDILFGAWSYFGGELHIKPARENGETVKFFYVSSYRVEESGGTLKATFTADTDTFRLPERLLTLGIVWNWKQRKGQDYAEDLALYREALAYHIGREKGPAKIEVGRRRFAFAARPAYPSGLG